ncbi:MAG: ASCH domain-containing protein [Propionibacteriales bacterium]|nr:ASCH domain-containing protein [Propionibacteriales bacterium]
MITSDERGLVHAAIEHATRWDDGADHTVAAALRTASGATVLGLNSYHFLGGPCGEVSALANHAASRPDDQIKTVVAAYGPTGQVIAPCGKCRQVLFDLDSAIECVIRTENGLVAMPVRDLLPFAYDWRGLEAPQRIHLWEGYESKVRGGSKQQTIRVDDPFRPGPAELVFEKESGETVLAAEVTAVRTVTLAELDNSDAQRDGFADHAELRRALDRHYPGLAQADEVDVVSFAVTEV